MKEKKLILRKVLFYFSIFLLLIGFVLILPVTKILLLKIAELLLHRPLRNSMKWIRKVDEASLTVFCISFFLIFSVPMTRLIKYFYKKSPQKFINVICICSIFIVSLIFVLPFIFFGKDSFLTIHDGLDYVPHTWIRENHLFWKLNVDSGVMNHTSTMYLNREGLALHNFILCFLPDYWNYVVINIVSFFVAFFSMKLFLNLIFKKLDHKVLITNVSLLYAILPSFVCYKISTASLPLAPFLFYKLISAKEKKWFLVCFLLPFISEISSCMVFVCAFWFLGIIVFSVMNRKISMSLLIGFILICVSTLIVNNRLIYMRLFVQEPLNRDFFDIVRPDFFSQFKQYFFFGHYHAASFTFPIGTILFMAVFYAIIRCIILRKIDFASKRFFRFISICFLCHLFAAIFSALSEAGILEKIICVFIPFLSGISLSRIFIFSKVILYVALAGSLIHISQTVKYGNFITTTVILFQFLYIFNSNTYYNDAKKTWQYNLTEQEFITYRKFFAEDLFIKIKKTVNYNKEPVCAVGYHPSVLMNNGFNCIDGYLSVYPYKDMLLWHNLMIPEFEHNEKDCNYFDSWGGRRYIYSDKIDFQPTLEKFHEPVSFDVDMNILRNDFKCKYILSRCELLNADEQNLYLKGIFDMDDSIYRIYLYEVLY